MDIATKISKIQQVGEEILTLEELKTLLETKSKPIAYDGFEPSGKLHIAQGILRAINVNKMTSTGVHFKMWVGDWFAWMNNKMGGDLDAIHKVGEYQIEVWKASGMDMNKIEFLWASDVMNDREYWKKVVNIARENSLPRIIRCAQIMGRSETDTLSAAQIFYPCMQCADVFHLNADITQLGMDQRKVNVLAREIAPKLGYKKPVVVSHHMLLGLEEPKIKDTSVDAKIEMKMSKSKPNSAIFMTDNQEEITQKIKKAYCPEKQIEFNPILEYYKYILFETQKTITLNKPAKFGGPVTYATYTELEKDYVKGNIHPLDLKNTASELLNQLVEPVRTHFEKNAKARKLKEFIDQQTVTR